MTEDQVLLREKARASLEAPRSLHEQGFHDFAASRAYYAMFYVAEALLLRAGLQFSKHSAVIAAFGKDFVKTGEVPAVYHNYLRVAEASRLIGDYEVSEHVTESRSAEHLKQAEEFLQLGDSLLRR